MSPVVFDCEVYPNYFLVMFRNIESGKTVALEAFEDQPFPRDRCETIMSKYELVSFNGRRFDVPLLMLAMRGEPVERIKEACDAIIKEKLEYWRDEFKERFPRADHGRDQFNHIDLIEVAPGTASLKIYGGRLHSKRMQDLPIEPDELIDAEQRGSLIEYCGNDLQTTIDLYHSLIPQIELRVAMGKQFGVDLRSKSDAQIAEQVIRGRVQRDSGAWIERPIIKPGTSFKYERPRFVSFMTDEGRRALEIVEEAVFQINETGNVELPPSLKNAEIKFGSSTYRMGIGGLHSSEASVAHKADGCRLIDRDVTSYYPAIILRLGMYPKQMGSEFLKVYSSLVAQRLRAKRDGDTVRADSMKITINGSFGKFGSKWSTLYSPNLLIQTTITGQLCLLMLIEMLEHQGVPVVSANTDGLVIKCPAGADAAMERCVYVWETLTEFQTEATEYKALYSRDVNNYVALKTAGGTKLKGVFTPPGLAKNPTNEICVEAVIARLESDIDIRETISKCVDIRKFITIRKANGGAVKGDLFLGKAVRWYYAKDEVGAITYKSTGYTVARSEGGKPLMTLPDAFPDDVDHDWYVREAEDILKDIGYRKDGLA